MKLKASNLIPCFTPRITGTRRAIALETHVLTIAPVTFLGASPPHLADAGLFSILEGRSVGILESREGRQCALLAQRTNWSNGGRKQYGDFAAERE